MYVQGVTIRLGVLFDYTAARPPPNAARRLAGLLRRRWAVTHY